MSSRIDLYRDVHKGIRHELSNFVVDLGRAELSDAEVCIAMAERFADLVDLLEAHARHEDQHVTPVLDRLAPSLSDALAREHVAYDARLAVLAESFGALVQAPVARRAALASTLYLDVCEFCSAYLRHLHREEREAMPALWRGLSDPELQRLHDELVGSIPPDEMLRFLRPMLRGMNTTERSEMLLGMRAGAPPEVATAVERLAFDVLSPPEWEALEARLREVA